VEEVELVLKQMHPKKALSPDSINPFYYQKF